MKKSPLQVYLLLSPLQVEDTSSIIVWLCSLEKITHALILSDLVDPLQNMECDGLRSLSYSHEGFLLQSLLLVYHPDHDGVRWNNSEEKLTSVADLTNHLQHGKKEVEVLRDLKNLRAWTDQDITLMA